MDGLRRRRRRWFGDNNYNNDKAVFEQIMQRFRPIVPKPATNGGEYLQSGSAGEKWTTSTKKVLAKGKGKKRKYYVRAAAPTKCKNKKEKEKDSSIFSTLQLLPADQFPIKEKEKEKEKDSQTTHPSPLPTTFRRGPLILVLDRTVETWVTVLESVTGNCMDEDDDGRGGLGGCRDDQEMIMNLGSDTCPGFISDGQNNVKWVNMAYRRMVWQDDDDDQKQRRGGGSYPPPPPSPPQVVVKLVGMTEGLAFVGSFSCRVKVQYYYNYYYYDGMTNCLAKQCRQQIVVPCDVWRMEFGGLAWRLDLQAALSLSLSLSLGPRSSCN